MRPIIFVCMFAIDMSLSFVPLRLGEIGPDLPGLPADVVMSLPVSFEMFMVGLAIMLGGFWSERAGWRPLLLTGVSLVTLGNLASGLSADPFLYIASRGVAGGGYGLLNLSAQLFVLAHSRPDQRAGNLATVFAGLFAGVLCGSASGGLIADRLGYAGAFQVAAALMFLTGVVLWRALPREGAPQRKAAAPARSVPGLRETLAFITDPRMAALLFLNIMPGAFVTVCLFQFFVPVSLNQGGASPADIGRVTMIFPLVIVYLGPVFGGIVDRSDRKYLHLALAGLVAAASVGALMTMDGIAAATLAVMLLGLSNAILSNAQGAYALELPATERYGAARAMGIYNVIERIGQVLGPVSLGLVIAVWGRNAGLGVMAIGLAGMSLAFAVASRRQPLKGAELTARP
jgi:predicted MFS family arabinose efflux permease